MIGGLATGAFPALPGGTTFAAQQSADEPEILGSLDILTRRGRFTPIIVLLHARRGRGKTVTMSAMAAAHRKRWDEAKVPYTVFANYWLATCNDECPRWGCPQEKGHIAHYSWEDMPNEMAQGAPWARHGLMCLDEAQEYLLSKRAISKQNVTIESMLRMVRKMRVDCFLTTQRAGSLSQDALWQIDYVVEVESQPWQFETDFRGNLEIRQYIFDFWGQDTGRPSQRVMPPPRFTWDKGTGARRRNYDDLRTLIFTPAQRNSIFRRFDSDWVIQSRYTDDRFEIDRSHRERRPYKVETLEVGADGLVPGTDMPHIAAVGSGDFEADLLALVDRYEADAQSFTLDGFLGFALTAGMVVDSRKAEAFLRQSPDFDIAKKGTRVTITRKARAPG